MPEHLHSASNRGQMKLEMFHRATTLQPQRQVKTKDRFADFNGCSTPCCPEIPQTS